MANVSKNLAALLKQRGLPSRSKAKKMLKEKTERSDKFRGLLGLIASGKLPHKLSEVSRSQRSSVKAK